MKLLREAVVVVMVVLTALPAAAADTGIRVEPGLWEFTSSLPDPLGGDAGNQVHRTCVRERTITPELVMSRLDVCRIRNAVIQGPSAKWKMSCDTPAGPMHGSGSLKSSGTAVAGQLEMTMALGSFEIPMSGSFRGRRLGACR